MMSLLNIDETVERYSLDEDMKQALIAFDEFIWQDCTIETVEQVIAIETEYNQRSKVFDFVYDSELGELGFVDMQDGPMVLLSKGRFQFFSENRENNEVYVAFRAAGLSELEALVIMTFRADISELYRLDAYYYGVPPVAKALCEILNSALSKLPAYTETVVRACHEYDKSGFHLGDIYQPGFCLTTSADLSWRDVSVNRFRIIPLEANSKARGMFLINNNTEFQVTFLQDASFRIVQINDWGEGKNEYVMEEI